MKDFLLTTAEEAGIKYQYYCGKGGTDAGAAHLKNAGVPSTTIGVCARYIHSHQTLYAMDDFLQAQAFLQALVKKMDRSRWTRLPTINLKRQPVLHSGCYLFCLILPLSTFQFEENFVIMLSRGETIHEKKLLLIQKNT